MSKDEFTTKLNELASNVCMDADADVFVYSGEIGRAGAAQVVALCQELDRKENAILLLSTYGGDAHSAYRMVRALTQAYERFILYIPGICKSAGTLIAVGADEIILSDYGELGPLDVQLRKEDEIFGETSSGLNLIQALNALQNKAFNMFEKCLIDTKLKSGGQITTKSATEIATKMSVGLFAEMYKQIDPIRLGEVERAINIAYAYGNRIGEHNLLEDALESLVAGYPSHSFVIDRAEAETLFKCVRAPNEAEEALAEHIGSCVLVPNEKIVVTKLTAQEEKQGAMENDDVPQNPAHDQESAGTATTDVDTASGAAKQDTAEQIEHSIRNRPRVVEGGKQESG